MGFILSLMVWLVFPLVWRVIGFNLAILNFLFVSRLEDYAMGFWFVDDPQIIIMPYWEVYGPLCKLFPMEYLSLVSNLLLFLVLVLSLNLKVFLIFVLFRFSNFLLCLMSLVSSLAEANRNAFDFAEEESKLVFWV